jgi:hypothetical protein
MIQRQQTIWFLISTILSGFLFKGGLINFIDDAGQKYSTGLYGIYKLNLAGNELIKSSVSMAALIVAIPVLSFTIILFYKSLRTQKVLALVLITLNLCLIILEVYYSYILIKNYNVTIEPGLKMIIPLLLLTTVILAFRGISRDEALIRSYNRLR